MVIRFSTSDSVRRGAVLPFVLLSLAVIVGMLALGMDGGRMMEERRRGQAVADVTALAAAADLYENWWTYGGNDTKGTAKDAALKIAAANGYANDGTTSVVTVNIPPKSGQFAGKACYVEVEVEYNLSQSFAAIFTSGPLKVRARAVARGQPAKIGLIALAPNGPDAFLNKSLALAVIGSPIIVNSTDPTAFHQASLGVVVASSADVTGGFVNTGGALTLGRFRTGVPPTADPLRKLAVPNAAALLVRSAAPLTINTLLPQTLQPGIYQGGITIKGLSIVTMNPGIYIMEGGGFQVSGLAAVAGLGVTIYNTAGAFPAGTIDIGTLGKVVLTAPTSGTYQGIGIFQDRSLNQAISITGSGLNAIAGTVYAPAAAVNLTGAAAVGLDTLGGAYISRTITVSGVGSVNVDLGNNPPRIPDVTLVE
jgi:hypothetical protein